MKSKIVLLFVVLFCIGCTNFSATPICVIENSSSADINILKLDGYVLYSKSASILHGSKQTFTSETQQIGECLYVTLETGNKKFQVNSRYVQDYSKLILVVMDGLAYKLTDASGREIETGIFTAL